jgi:hypothetical protein
VGSSVVGEYRKNDLTIAVRKGSEACRTREQASARYTRSNIE